MRICLIMLCLFFFPTNILGQFGELPPDPIGTLYISGVKAEIVIHLIVDRSILLNPIPKGTTLSYPPEYYIKDLKIKPDTNQVAFVTLLSIIADTIIIDNTPIKSFDGSLPAMTSLWIWVEQPKETFDERVIGYQGFISQMDWYPNSDLVDHFNSIGIPSQYGITKATPTNDGWDVTLQLDQSKLSIVSIYKGELSPMNYSLPAFSTVWYSTERPSLFTIYTYYGHYVQECDIHIKTNGKHKLIKLIQDGLNKGVLQPNIQSKWRAKAGIYRRLDFNGFKKN